MADASICLTSMDSVRTLVTDARLANSANQAHSWFCTAARRRAGPMVAMGRESEAVRGGSSDEWNAP